jgi:hypothetical protein
VVGEEGEGEVVNKEVFEGVNEGVNEEVQEEGVNEGVNEEVQVVGIEVRTHIPVIDVLLNTNHSHKGTMIISNFLYSIRYHSYRGEKMNE